jgi:ABC-type antimicrobial peptide transport system permease subunit
MNTQVGWLSWLFSPYVWKKRLRDLPDNLRIAALSSWRDKERGLAVFAGVFLASLVITLVLVYGVGLSQAFLEESLEQTVFDSKIEFKNAPAQGSTGWTNNTTILQNMCDEVTLKEEFSDCTVILGKSGIHSELSFSNDAAFYASPLFLKQIESSDNDRDWNQEDLWDYEYTTGPPVVNIRAISFLGPEAFDGEISERLSKNIIYEMGEWKTHEEVHAERGIYIPLDIASTTGAEVGDKIDRLTFTYTSERSLPGGMSDEDCAGQIIEGEEFRLLYCQIPLTLDNVTILGIYEPWPQGNPVLAANPIYTTWTILDENQQTTLIDNDHVYLGVTVDRALLPTSSISAAEDWLEIVENDMQKQTYDDGNVKIFYVDIISSSILWLEFFLGFVQVFDYILMIPVVILSLYLLIYGLELSLEQRRREISIHRAIGATAEKLKGMVLFELFIISTVAWLGGYLLALVAVPFVLSSVGFMEFEALEIDVKPSLSFGSTFFTILTTLGLALIFGNSRTKSFLEMEIDEGVKKTKEAGKPRVWLHWTMFVIGAIGAFDTWQELNTTGEGIITNWFVGGLINIFGPFLLWIGGALLLSRLGAAGPTIMLKFFRKTPLLSDVKRGLEATGTNESTGRLATIMLLTLSIVTLAAVQGFTGSLVDERTADLEVGSDIKVYAVEPMTSIEVEEAITNISSKDITVNAVNVPIIPLVSEDGTDVNAYVLMNESTEILKWFPQAIPGEDISEAMIAYKGGGFTAGSDIAFTLDLWGSGRYGDSEDILLEESNKDSENLTFTWEETIVTFTGDENETSNPIMALAFYAGLMEKNWSNLDLSNQDLSSRNFTHTDFSNTNLSGANLTNSDLSESIFFNVDLRGANLAGANLNNAIFVIQPQNIIDANFTNANLSGAFEYTGIVNLSSTELSGVTCPDGTIQNNDNNCAAGFSTIPPPLLAPIFIPATIEFEVISHETSIRYIGVHEFIPGVATNDMNSYLVINEQAYRELRGNQFVDTETATTWIVDIDGLNNDELQVLNLLIAADSRFEGANDWETSHENVERNGGIIFGTQGLFTLQYLVASVAAIASSFVFLSLVLNQKKKELAILQAIGASPNQIIRLVLFEILSIVFVSMILGVILGIGLALSFNGLFNIFGFLFQLFSGTGETSVITRVLQWPWWVIIKVTLGVLSVVVLALIMTTRRALRADLAVVLKGE